MTDNEEKTENQELQPEPEKEAAGSQSEPEAEATPTGAVEAEAAENPEPETPADVEAAPEAAAAAAEGEEESQTGAEATASAKEAKPRKKTSRKSRRKKKAEVAKREVKVPEVKALEGEQAGLDPEIFGVKPKIAVLHEVVRAEFASRRRGTASAKNRSEVRGGGVKPWRQKGTGRARAGSSRMPHWTGGGIVFGPVPKDYKFKVNRKVRSRALKMALSARAGEGGFKVVDALPFEEPQTSAGIAVLEKLEVKYPLLVLLTEADDNAALSLRNIPRVDVTGADDLLVSDIMAARMVLATKEAVSELNRVVESR